MKCYFLCNVYRLEHGLSEFKVNHEHLEKAERRCEHLQAKVVGQNEMITNLQQVHSVMYKHLTEVTACIAIIRTVVRISRNGPDA